MTGTGGAGDAGRPSCHGAAAVRRAGRWTVTLAGGDRFDVRASDTEPLLRLIVRATDAAVMTALRADILALIRA